MSITHPELAKEFHSTKNGFLTSSDIVAGSNRKLWWQCKINPIHEWVAKGSERVQGTGCPFCSRQKIDQTNCMKTTHPDLAKEFHPTKNGNLTPENVPAGTGKKLWWKC